MMDGLHVATGAKVGRNLNWTRTDADDIHPICHDQLSKKAYQLMFSFPQSNEYNECMQEEFTHYFV